MPGHGNSNHCHECDKATRCEWRMSDLWLCEECDKNMHAEMQRKRELQEETRPDQLVNANSIANKNVQSSISNSRAANKSSRPSTVSKSAQSSTSTSLSSSNNISTSTASQNMQTSNLLVEPLLAYITFAMQSATEANIKRAVLGRFDHEEIIDAKTKLWSCCGEEKLGEFQRRKDSSSRSEREAHLADIISALIRLDNEDKMPTIAIEAMSLGKIPRSHPEELNNISMADRLNQMEHKMASLAQVLDTYIQDNMAMRKEIECLKKKGNMPKKTFAEMVCATANKLSVSAVSSVESSTNDGKILPSRNPQQSIGDVEGLRNTEVIAEGEENQTASIAPSRDQLSSQESHQEASSQESHQEASSQEEPSESQHEARGSQQDNSTSKSEDSGFQKQRHQRKKERQQEVRKERRSKHQYLTGRGASRSGVRGAPEPVRYLFIKNIMKGTPDSDVHDMIEEKGFVIRELKRISHPDAKGNSFKLSVPASQFDRLFDEDLWPAGVKIRIYRAPKAQ